MRTGAARMSPPTTQTLRLTMNGSAGLKVVILVALAGRLGICRSGWSRTSNMKLLNSAATSTPTVTAMMHDEQALAQLVEVLEQRQTFFGGERHAVRLRSRDPPASRSATGTSGGSGTAGASGVSPGASAAGSCGGAGARGTSANTVCGVTAGVSGPSTNAPAAGA